MTPEARAEMCEAIASLCPGFVAVPDEVRARKSALVAGTLDGLPVIAKRVAKPDPVSSWYLAREVAIYRAFAARPPLGIRVPRLHAATETLLVIERIVGPPLATRRKPQLASAPDLSSTLAALARYPLPDLPPSAAVRTRLRARMLEDPSDPTWIRAGVALAAKRGVITASIATGLIDAIADAPIAIAHGDLLARNIVCAPDPVLVDWECAGRYLADWDRALYATQLADPSAIAGPPGFHALAAFAYLRELHFMAAFPDPSPGEQARLRDALRAALRRGNFARCE